MRKSFLFLLVGLWGICAGADKVQSANVMAPLLIQTEPEWAAFEQQLAVAKGIGVDAVTVDVWWGKVETADQTFDWGYYDRIFNCIEAAGLHWIPIMSFHKCGGNVGDTVTIGLPAWIWASTSLPPESLKYKSEQGHYCDEVVSLWADSKAVKQYAQFMDAFEDHFGSKAGFIDEVNISTGPSGELRYPSYNSHDSGSGYPSRGTFQAYGDLAVQSFRNFALKKYGTLERVAAIWQIPLQSKDDIRPPSSASTFVGENDYYDMVYGRDFIEWYNQSLVTHGKRMLAVAAKAFDGDLAEKPIGIKVSGVHWTMKDPQHPRTAELAAGLIRSCGYAPCDSTGYGYSPLVSMLAAFNTTGRKAVLHFTCLEMSNEDWAPQFSLAKDLTFWVAREAKIQGVVIKGENALSGGVLGDQGWANIRDAFAHAPYTGLTVLRIGEVTANEFGREHYRQFIQDFGQN